MNSEHIKFVSSKHGRIRIFAKTKYTGKIFNQVVTETKTFKINDLTQYFKNDCPVGKIYSITGNYFMRGKPVATMAIVLKSLKKLN